MFHGNYILSLFLKFLTSNVHQIIFTSFISHYIINSYVFSFNSDYYVCAYLYILLSLVGANRLCPIFRWAPASCEEEVKEGFSPD